MRGFSGVRSGKSPSERRKNVAELLLPPGDVLGRLDGGDRLAPCVELLVRLVEEIAGAASRRAACSAALRPAVGTFVSQVHPRPTDDERRQAQERATASNQSRIALHRSLPFLRFDSGWIRRPTQWSRMRKRQGKRVEPGFGRVGAGHEDDGRGRASQDASEPAIGRVHDRLDGEVGRQQVGKEHDVGRPDDRALDALLGPGVGGVGQVKRERAFDQAVGRTRPAGCAARARRPRRSRASTA